MEKKFIQCVTGAIALLALFDVALAKSPNHHDSAYMKTDAGPIDFHFKDLVKYPAAYHHIVSYSETENSVELEDGSKWSVAKFDRIRGWDKSEHLVLIQNQATLSTYRYALANADLKLAVPISLLREPTPDKTLFIQHIDYANDLVTLSDGQQWIIHSSDAANVNKMRENDRVIIGANVYDSGENKSPYILVDTGNHHFARATLLEP